MSDSEYASSCEEVATKDLSPLPPPTPSKKSKSKPAAAAPPKPRKRKTTIPPVANIEAYAPPSSSRSKKPKGLFSILNKDERATSKESARSSSLGSSFTSRVSSGQCRRATTVVGEFYVDLKVYHTDDIKDIPATERYKRALASVKLQCGEQSQHWESLQDFLGKAYSVFEDCEPVYYSNKINIK